MALDPEGGAAVPTKKKRKREAAPVVGEQATGGAKTPTRRPYQSRPTPTFERIGFSGDMLAFNRRAEAASSAFERSYGYAPSPALILDLVRAPVTEVEYEDLFQVPQTFQRARAASVLGEGPKKNISEVADIGIARQSHIRDSLDPNNDTMYERDWNRRWIESYDKVFRVLSGQGDERDIGLALSDLERDIQIHQRILGDISEFRSIWGRRTDEGISFHEGAIERYKRVIRAIKQDRGKGQLPPDVEGTFIEALGIGHGVQDPLEAVKEVVRKQIAARRLLARDLPGDREVAEELQTGVDASLSEQEAALQAAESGPRGTLDTAQGVETMGIRDDLGLPGLAAIQIGESLVYAPAGAYEVGKALGFDVRDAARDRDFSFERSRETGKQIAKGIVETYQNPGENPGYIFMDALGLASGIAGTGARLGRARRAARGKRFNEFARRPDPGTDELGGENVLLSQNALVASAQRIINRKRRAGFERRKASSPPPMATLPSRHKVVGQFTTEAKIGREARARQRVEHELAMGLVRDMEAARGWSINSARALSRMPRALKKGLSRGEQKAIQVLSTDEPGGWEAQLALHREHHQRMIADGIGDPKAHTRQLADLDLAEVAFNNPTKRFEEVSELVREVMTQGELLKISALGLDVAAAESRIANYAEVLRGGVPEEGALRRSPDSFYLPSVPRRHARKPVAKFIPIPRPGRFGIPEPRNLPELTHWFSGKSLRWGDFRIDATNLAGESYARAVRLVALRGEHQRLLAQAKDKQTSPWDVPIRDTDAIPDELREVVNQMDEGAVTKKDIDRLDPNFQNALYQHLFPETGVKGAKWIDSRLIGDAWRYPNEPGFGTKLATAINEPFRTATLFLRPAYGVGNLLGNSAMLMMQSLGAPNNLRKALTANKRYGAKNARTIDALVGEGRSLSFSPDDLIQTKVSRTLAHGWNALVDQKFRSAAFIHEMERKGYKTKEDVTRLLDPTTQDAKIKKDRVEISRRANKAMVEFNNLTPFEKNTMRHLVFVYPWVSRSIVWSLRTMVEHPTKTWTLVQLGKLGEDKAEEVIGEQVPEWFTNTGYFPLYQDDDGRPVVVNPQSLNTFSTFPEILRVGKSLTEKQLYDSPEDLSSPVLELGIRALTGRDKFGNKYDVGNVEGALREQFGDLPQVRAFDRYHDYKNREEIAARPPDERPSFIPRSVHDVYAPLILSGWWPRTPDTEALAADWFRDQPKEMRDVRRTEDRAKIIKDRLAVERRAIMQATQAEAQIIGKSVPQEVRNALELQMRFAERYADALLFKATDKEGNTKEAPKSFLYEQSPTFAGGPQALTPLSKRHIQVNVLFETGRINDDERDKLHKQVDAAAVKGSDALTDWGDKFSEDYLNAKALQEWWDERDSVLDVAANADNYIKTLRRGGLYTGVVGKPDTESLLKVGRNLVEYEREQKARTDDTGARSDLVTLDNSLDRAWLDEQDKPISIDGKKYPSPVRLAWARKNGEERLEAVSDLAVASWDTLSNFEKEIIGKKPAPGVSRGWAILNAVMDGYRGNLTAEDVPNDMTDLIPDALPEGQRTIEKDHKIALAKWVDQNFAEGFYKDFLFSLQPKYQRLRVLPVITKSKAVDEWREVFQRADASYGYVKRAREIYDSGKRPPYSITAVQDQWDDYAKQLYSYYQEEGSQTFKDELELLGGVDLLRTLISDG